MKSCGSSTSEATSRLPLQIGGRTEGSFDRAVDFPFGRRAKPSASSRVYPIRCLTSGSGIVRNGLFLLRLWDVTKIPSQRSKQKRKKLKAQKEHRVSSTEERFADESPELSRQLLGSGHGLEKRRSLQYRPLGFAAWLVQELRGRTQHQADDDRKIQLEIFW